MVSRVLPVWFGPFAARPRLVLALGAGLAVMLALRGLAGLETVTAGLIGWDVLCLGYAAATLLGMPAHGPTTIRARAAAEDEGRATILTFILVAATAGLAAIVLELSQARYAVGLERGLRIALAFVTVAASWFTVHLIFALHYAHRYYAPDADAGGDARGLTFPGEQEPDYWDFLYFSIIIGVACQTADVIISDRRVRRLNTVHALFSFTFNTVVVALTINMLAAVFA